MLISSVDMKSNYCFDVGSHWFLFSHSACRWRFGNNWTYVQWLSVLLFIYMSNILLYTFIITFILKRGKNAYAENFMTGYRVVFDRENLKLGWSNSKCEFSFFSSFVFIKNKPRPHNLVLVYLCVMKSHRQAPFLLVVLPFWRFVLILALFCF